MGRMLTFNIFRYNPVDPDSQPHMDTFRLDETERMTLFIALNRIREEIDPTLMFDFCCRAGICGACAMVINGRPGLACHTKTKDLPGEITLMPLPVFKLVGDLSVDTGTWFRGMGHHLGAGASRLCAPPPIAQGFAPRQPFSSSLGKCLRDPDQSSRRIWRTCASESSLPQNRL